MTMHPACRLRRRISVLCFGLPLLPGIVHAAVADATDLSASFRVMWGLLVVLAVILLLYGLLRKRFSLLQPRGAKAIRIVEMQPLMARKALCLVEVRGREYLIGVANETVTLLADLGQEQPESFKESLERSTREQQS